MNALSIDFKEQLPRLISDFMRQNLHGESVGSMGGQPTPESTVSQIDEYLDRIVVFQQEVSKAIDREVGSARAKRNGLVRLHQLPIELFIHILQLSLPLPERGPTYAFDLHNLRLTCRRWRDMIDAEPSLWVVAAVGYSGRGWNPNLVYAAVEKMKGTYPLHIYGRFNTHQHSRLIRQLAPCIDRCETLHARMQQSDETLQFLSVPAPRLRQFRLRDFLASPPSTNQTFNLFKGQAERLEGVMVWDCELPWESSVFRGLISLELYRCRGLKISHLTDILVASPDLTSLKLDNNNFVVDDRPGPEAALEMGHLKVLTIIEIGAERLTPLIDAFRAPNCQRLHLRMELAEGDNSTTFLLSTLSPYSSVVRKALAKHSSVFIDMTRKDILKIKCKTGLHEDSAVPLNLWFEGITINDSIQFLQTVMAGIPGSGPRVKLVLGRDWGEAGGRALSEIARNCSVVDLWIGSFRELLPFEAYGVLQKIGEPEVTSTLETLTISGRDWSNARILDGMLRLREGWNGRSHAPLHLSLLGWGKDTEEHPEATLREFDMIQPVRWLRFDIAPMVKYNTPWEGC